MTELIEDVRLVELAEYCRMKALRQKSRLLTLSVFLNNVYPIYFAIQLVMIKKN